MAIFQPRPDPRSGNTFLETVQGGISHLLNTKMNEMAQQKQQEQTKQGLRAAGLPEALAHLPPQALQAWGPKMLEQQQKAQAAERLAPLASRFYQVAAGNRPTAPGQQGQGLPGQQPQGTPGQPGMGMPQEKMSDEEQRAEMNKVLSEISQVPGGQEIAKELGTSWLNQQRIDVTKKGQEGISERFSKKLGFADVQSADKETKKYYDEVSDKRGVAFEQNAALDKMEKLNEADTLNSPAKVGMVDFLSEHGINATSILNADSQQFTKLTLSFMKNLKTIFGARPTQFDAQIFLKSIPTLMNSKEGRRKIIQDFKTLNKFAIDQADTMDSIVDEYNAAQGTPESAHRPRNLHSLLHKEFAPRAKEIFKDFVAGKSEGSGSEQVPQGIPQGSKLAFESDKVIPQAANFPGGFFPYKGKTYKSDGTRWIPYQGAM